MRLGDSAEALSQAPPCGALFGAMDLFPWPICVFSPDGTSARVNGAFEACFGIRPEQVVGKLNILRDPYLQHTLGLSGYLRRAFAGEVLSVEDIRVPSEEICRRYGAGKRPCAAGAMYQRITCFPVRDAGGGIACIVAMFLMTRVYEGQPAVAKAREYLENTWMDAFDMAQVASAARLSRYHLARLFKKHVGMTPYAYYQHLKVEKIKEALRDRGLSIAQAFSACGVDYSGNLAGVFKEKTGMTPSQYRRSLGG